MSGSDQINGTALLESESDWIRCVLLDILGRRICFSDSGDIGV